MAITLGTRVKGFASTSSTLTLPGVTCSGSDRVLEVAVVNNNPTFTVSSVVFNGTENLSQVRFRNISSGTIQRLEVWGLTAPSASTGDVVITMSGAVNMTAIAQPMSGVDQTTPRESGNPAAATPIYRDGAASETNPRDTAGSASVLWGGGNDLQMFWVSHRDDTLSWTADSNITQVENAVGAGLTNHCRLVLLTDTDTQTGKPYGTIGAATSWQAIGYNLNAAAGASPPTAAFSGTPTSGTVPRLVTFTDASTNTPTSWDWDFGDGGTSTSQNPTHTYTVPGTYTVTLTATNADGSDSEVKTNYITVTAAAPVANFTADPLTGAAPRSVAFTDTSTNTPTSWAWDFGDTGTSTDQNPTHEYTAAGTYTVELVATNAGGSDTETKTNYITITEPSTSGGTRYFSRRRRVYAAQIARGG